MLGACLLYYAMCIEIKKKIVVRSRIVLFNIETVGCIEDKETEKFTNKTRCFVPICNNKMSTYQKVLIKHRWLVTNFIPL